MNRYFFILFFVLPWLTTTAMASDNPITHHVSEHVLWDKLPISFVVPTGVERIISFEGPVSVKSTSDKLTRDKVTLLNNNGTLYIRAKQAFTPIRLAVTLNSTGETMLVDLSSRPNSDDTPVEVVTKIQNEKHTSQSSATTRPSYVSLMRYAIHHLFAPERLITQSPQITRTPMYTQKHIALFKGEEVQATPLASWRAGNLYVTAVFIKNPWDKTIHLSPEAINGRFLAMSFYPGDTLKPTGDKRDRTTCFFISNQPFDKALHAIDEVRV